METLVRIAAGYGVDLPLLAGIMAAAILSWPLNGLVSGLHKRELRKLIKSCETKTGGEVEAEYKSILSEFDMDFAATIGKLERIVYIIAVAIGQLPLIGGWLILKAFTGWLRPKEQDETRAMTYYHLYLYGNLLSLLLGLALGGLAVVVDKSIASAIVALST